MVQLKTSLLVLILSTTLSCSHFSTNRLPAASAPFAAVEAGNVFASYEPLKVELEAPLKDLFDQNRQDIVAFKKQTLDGTLSYWNDQGQKISLPVSIKAKGFSSTSFCTFPKLELKFTSKDREGTLFAKTKTMDLNTHCGDPAQGGSMAPFMKAFNFNHREALVYRMAEVLGIPTFKARPLFVKYSKTKISAVDQSPNSFRAFFLEDAGNFTKRLNGKEIKGTDDSMKPYTLAVSPEKATMFAFTDVKSSSQVDPEDAVRIALFQTMIGNSDWFIKMTPSSQRGSNDPTNLWNTKIVELPSGHWVLFPQDFNFANINLGFPAVPTNFGKEILDSVDSATMVRLKQNFKDKKEDVYKLLKTLQADPEGPALMQKTLDSFYSQL